jgi:hypothetical protein
MGWFIHHYGIVCTTFTRLKDALLLELGMTENRPVGMGEWRILGQTGDSAGSPPH